MKKVIDKAKTMEPLARSAPQASANITPAASTNQPPFKYSTSGFYKNAIKKPIEETVPADVSTSKFFLPPQPIGALQNITGSQNTYNSVTSFRSNTNLASNNNNLRNSIYNNNLISASTSNTNLASNSNLVTNNNNIIDSITKNNLITKEYLSSLFLTEKSTPDLLPSVYVPMTFTQQKHFEGALAGALVGCLKTGMTQEEAFLIAAFQFGSPGSNITILQTLSKLKLLKKTMDMLPYLPPFDTVPETLKYKLTHLPTREFMFFYESITMLQLNQDLNIKLQFYQENEPLENSVIVQNLTGNRCPDFVRNFDEPIGTIIQEAYDQKSLGSPLLDNNHIRPVSGNLEEKTTEAIDHLITNVEEWSLTHDDKPKTIAQNLLDSLKNLKDTYAVNQNSSLYASSYNKLRNAFGEFLIQNKITMNLITEVSLQKLSTKSENSMLYRQLFITMYYSPESPWLAFANAQVQKNNVKNINYDSVIKAFAEHLASDVD